MVKVDLSDFNRLAGEYRQRAAALQSRPMGDQQTEVQHAIREMFRGALMENEGITQRAQNELWETENIGYYGAKFEERNPEQVNPQEFIDPGTSPSQHTRGQGSLYGSSSVRIVPTGQGAVIDLVTSATMQPYPNINLQTGEVTYSLPARPIMYYIRHGWVDTLNRKHTMGARPQFSQRVARTGMETGVVTRFLSRILKSIGFRERT